MLIICIIQAMAIGLAIVTMKKNISKWILAFNLWWLFLLILNELFPFGNYDISDNAYFCFGSFLFFTSIGYIFPKSVKSDAVIDQQQTSLENQYMDLIINNNVIRLFIFLLTVSLIYYAYRYTSYMSDSSILYARTARFYVGYIFNSTIELLLFNYIISAGRFLLVFIISFGIIYRKYKNISFFLSILGLLLYSYIGGSRFPLVLLVMEIIVLFVIKRETDDKRKSIMSIVKFVLMAICGFVMFYFLMLYFTAHRLGMKGFDIEFLSSASLVLYDQVINYNIGPLAGFSKMLDSGMLYNHFYFGQAVVLNGIDELFRNLLALANIPFESARYTIGEIAAQTISIGNRSFNALYSCVYWFFSDLGYLGVIIYSFVFGIVENKIVSNYYLNKNLWSLMLIVHCLYFLLMSNFNWEINTVDSLVYILFIVTYLRKKYVRYQRECGL